MGMLLLHGTSDHKEKNLQRPKTCVVYEHAMAKVSIGKFETYQTDIW